jgi:hypothetical protein
MEWDLYNNYPISKCRVKPQDPKVRAKGVSLIFLKPILWALTGEKARAQNVVSCSKIENLTQKSKILPWNRSPS